jgi:hypothetical protein
MRVVGCHPFFGTGMPRDRGELVGRDVEVNVDLADPV